MRRPALLVLWVLELWLAVALALAALAWIWSGSPGSLAQALQWASRLLPADQRLQAGIGAEQPAERLLTKNERGAQSQPNASDQTRGLSHEGSLHEGDAKRSEGEQHGNDQRRRRERREHDSGKGSAGAQLRSLP